MAAPIRSSAGDLRTSRRLRRGRAFSGWRRWILVAAVLTTAITALLTFYIPYPLSIGSSQSPPPPPVLQPIPWRATSVLDSISTNSSFAWSIAPPPPPVRSSHSSNVDSSNGGRKATPLRREIAYWRMSPDEALTYAKKEIENAPLVVDDPDLHAPLFRNVSVFKRMVRGQFSTHLILKEYMLLKGGF
ncbi:uncharacterized protein [Typha angustifolia]|uniref:uncharacterized protein n=1 Tax=Typha angustifolia TaxID=59011 RepID=UPI003C3047E8